MLQETYENLITALFFGVILFTLVACGSNEPYPVIDRKKPSQNKVNNATWNFDKSTIGKLPAHWKVALNNESNPTASWQVIKDSTAPSGDQVLAMTQTLEGGFNTSWTDSMPFLNGEISVRFKAINGRIDQGGGLMWRLQDKDNYYIARFNPLENNLRVYTVRDGVRRQITSATINLPAKQWHTLKIIQQGNKYEGYLNEKKLLEGTNDMFTQEGGVGLWTKADAVTSFDDLSVTPLK